MQPEQELSGSVEEAVELVQALNALRDVLNTTSLYLKDIQASNDFAAQGRARGQADAVLQNLRHPESPHPG